MSRQIFCVTTKFGQEKCYYVATKLAKVKRIDVAIEYSYIATKFSLDKGF